MAKEPVRYSQKIFREICDRIASGESLTRICKDDHMPAGGAVLNWVVRNHDDCAEEYLRARETQAMMLVDQIVSIADDDSQDVIETNTGERLNKEFAERSKIRIETRKWFASKVLPKIYGDKVSLAHEGTVNVNHNLSGVALLLAAAKANKSGTLGGAGVEETTEETEAKNG